jgi:DnaJ-class molecular chaperone
MLPQIIFGKNILSIDDLFRQPHYLPMTKHIYCDDCEGTGRDLRPAPQFDDPYRVVPGQDLCKTCGGTGYVDTRDSMLAKTGRVVDLKGV